MLPVPKASSTLLQGLTGTQGTQGVQGLDGAFAGIGAQGVQGIQGIIGRATDSWDLGETNTPPTSAGQIYVGYNTATTSFNQDINYFQIGNQPENHTTAGLASTTLEAFESGDHIFIRPTANTDRTYRYTVRARSNQVMVGSSSLAVYHFFLSDGAAVGSDTDAISTGFGQYVAISTDNTTYSTARWTANVDSDWEEQPIAGDYITNNYFSTPPDRDWETY